ncbi:unnamed protein product [Nezara viridula]|uniref:Uncharacterized protein n=1 Tax=Nezara viridula TaxID=85310 RepID=A0A9P0GX74_NEZVI|nr:unnamed protein product [Nezara viridula]
MVQTQVPHPHHNYADALWCTYIVSVVAANIAEFLTYPLDLTKTRLQIQGEVAANSNGNPQAAYRGMVKTALGIVHEEGFLKLWQGITPAVYRHVVYSGIRIVTYEYLRQNVLKKNDDGSFPIWYVFGFQLNILKHYLFPIRMKLIVFQLVKFSRFAEI